MIIIPGIAKSGTSYLAKKIHEVGPRMYKHGDGHYEDRKLLSLLSHFFFQKFGNDTWYTDQLINEQTQHDVVNNILKPALKDLDGTKNPRLIHFMPALISEFPEAKFIICRRHFNDWLGSNIGHHRNGKDWRVSLTAHYKYCNEIIKTYKNKVFIFQYENGSQYMHQEKLKEFIGLDIDMSDFKPKIYGEVHANKQ